MPISSSQLKIISIIATVVGIYGLVVFIQLNSPIFLFTSIANLGLAAFFWYKYKKKISNLCPKKATRASTYISKEGTVSVEPLTQVKQEV